MGKSILLVSLVGIFLTVSCQGKSEVIIKESTTPSVESSTISESSIPSNFTITLELNDGSTPVTTVSNEDNVYFKPLVLNRENYVFSGWFNDDELTQGVTWTNSDYITLTENKTIYAKWIEGTNVPYAGNYYDSINFNSSRQELFTQLKTLITIDLPRDPYELAKTTLQYSDMDPNNSDNVLLVYNRASVPGPWSYGGVNWNREHTWPQSKMPGPGNELDNHNLKPCNPSINSSRGNKAYGETTTTSTYYPGEADKGDVSRIIMYMSVRWDLTISGAILEPSLLQKWNTIDPVDAFEANRNSVIETYQHNRNPFIDYPELAYYFWG
jgi:uncharacterized repeat protein (TIGR02543 family)